MSERSAHPKPAPAPSPSGPAFGAEEPIPNVVLRLESVAVDAAHGRVQSAELPVLELTFDYAGQRVPAGRDIDRVLAPSLGGLMSLPRHWEAESRARRVLESFGAVELECLDDHAVSPDSRADYLVRMEGDVHDYCTFGAWVVPQLRGLGFVVDIDAGYPYAVVEAPPPWYAELTADRPDWFTLELGIELEGKRVNLLPALLDVLQTTGQTRLSSLSARRVAVPLPDGRYLPLPTERVRRILRIVDELYKGTPEAETLLISWDSGPAVAQLDSLLREDDHGFTLHDDTDLLERGRELLACERPAVAAERPAGVKATLRDYQVAGVQWLQHLVSMEVGGILADDMGLGKTLQTIVHIAIEKAKGALSAPALVVAPTSLVGNWHKEIGKFAPHLRVLVVHGPQREALYPKIPQADVVLTSYPILVRDEEDLVAAHFHLVVLDEAHTVKNWRGLAHQAVKRLNATHRLCITGTPMENHLGELWALFDVLSPGLLGDELSFRRRYRVPVEVHGDLERLDALRERVAPYMLRRHKRDVAKELPTKTELQRPVLLGPAQRELYESIRIAAHAQVRKVIAQKGLAASTVPILDALTKLRQVCCDPRLLSMRAASRVRASAKYEALFSLLTSQLGRGHRVLIFSQFTRMLALIGRGLAEQGIGYLELTGQSKERQNLVDAFESGRADVFLISLKAGGVGLTLTRADTVIHYDPWWNPAAQDQATDRAYRIGQGQPVVVHHLLVAGSVEERMMQLQRHKRRLAEGVLGSAAPPAPFCADDVDSLFAPLSLDASALDAGSADAGAGATGAA